MNEYGYALELAFDPTTHTAIKRVHAAMASAGIGNPDAVTAFPPHVSLVVGQSLNVPAGIDLLERFARQTPAFPLTFSYLGVFNPPSAVFYMGVTATLDLLTLHDDFGKQVAGLYRHVWGYYRPTVWVPHCTVAVNVAPAHHATALARCADVEIPFVAHATRIFLGRTTHNGGEVLASFPLAT